MRNGIRLGKITAGGCGVSASQGGIVGEGIPRKLAAVRTKDGRTRSGAGEGRDCKERSRSDPEAGEAGRGLVGRKWKATGAGTSRALLTANGSNGRQPPLEIPARARGAHTGTTQGGEAAADRGRPPGLEGGGKTCEGTIGDSPRPVSGRHCPG